MLEINVQSNIDEAIFHANDFFRNQVPFGTSIAINATIKDIRERIIKSTYPNAFTVRNRAFPGRVFRRKFATPRDNEGVLFDSLGRDWLSRQAAHEGRVPFRGSHLAIPINVPRLASGGIPKRLKPRAISSKKSSFWRTGRGGKTILYERRNKQVIARYVLATKANPQTKTFRFYQDAEDTFDRVFNGHWNRGMARAIGSSRLFR